MFKSNQFPVKVKEVPFTPGKYRRVKVWSIHSKIGDFIIYAVDAKAARAEFLRLRPYLQDTDILNTLRKS